MHQELTHMDRITQLQDEIQQARTSGSSLVPRPTDLGAAPYYHVQ